MASTLFQELSELSQTTDSNAVKSKLLVEMATENLSMMKRLKANHDALLAAARIALVMLDKWPEYNSRGGVIRWQEAYAAIEAAIAQAEGK